MEETYEISIVCRNCHHVPGEQTTEGFNDHLGVHTSKKFQVPKGTTIQKFLQEITCENCGCEGFMGIN